MCSSTINSIYFCEELDTCMIHYAIGTIMGMIINLPQPSITIPHFRDQVKVGVSEKLLKDSSLEILASFFEDMGKACREEIKANQESIDWQSYLDNKEVKHGS